MAASRRAKIALLFGPGISVTSRILLVVVVINRSPNQTLSRTQTQSKRLQTGIEGGEGTGAAAQAIMQGSEQNMSVKKIRLAKTWQRRRFIGLKQTCQD